VNASAIPVELRELPQWVVWRLELRDGKQTKVPYRADGSGRASTTDPATWATFETALEAAPGYDGIGFVFSADDPYVGVDLDTVGPNAAAAVRSLNTYAERSVSGRGVHVIARASVAGHPRRRTGRFECYESGRFFVVTGDHLPGTPSTIESRQAELDEVLARVFPKPAPSPRPLPSRPVDLDDRALLEKMFGAANGARVRALWFGDTSGYPSHSEADAALVSHLVWWTCGDGDRVDRLFRSSGLMRPKWESPRGASTYGALTVSRALERAAGVAS
jgi:primase-polymerase (primpol)-like protein